MTDWNKANIAILKAGIAAGDSYGQIAKRIPNCGRSGAIGKAHRLGLSQPPAPSKPASPARAAHAKPSAPRPVTLRLAGNSMVFHHEPEAARPPRETVVVRDETPGAATVLTLRNSSCRWPIGDPQADDFTFCGGKAVPGQPYCPSHAARAYQPSEVKPGKRSHDPARALRRYI